MIETAFYTVALTAAVWAMWVRRGAWRVQWERTTTSAIAQLAVALVLIAPATEPYTGWLFWELTGRWHIGDMLGHMLALGALVSSNIAGMMRMPTMRRYMEPLLWIPLVIGTTVLMQLFWRSSVTHNSGHDLFAVPHDHWLSVYFALLWALVVYYWALNAWVALNHLGGDPRSRPVALTWLVCIGIGAGAMLGWLVPSLGAVNWCDYGRLAMCASVAIFAVGSARSWQRKLDPYRNLIRATGARL